MVALMSHEISNYTYVYRLRHHDRHTYILYIYYNL